ncbi:sigma-70 family RNA polymerase sigma factor [Lentisphaera profundi]|uniref:Sigma-70 family RNA polymerase sigma factor n=1 Tax=Lentisphaera profundi TaxID=1658616 RepID=A0ABY7VWW2_9BACT|nr:sigma-70 family RNA polymerase sigma factor [Lentisphaera profundi]WDE98582.1 sigma-70 family RNA polymerase sigma factor [Lentisphaera profundi]
MDDIYKTRLTLLKKIQDKNDEAAWEEFIEIYKNYIYAIIRKVGVPQDDIEDIMQRIMIKIWTQLPKMDTDEIRRFRSYLGKICQNAIFDFIKIKTTQAQRMENIASNPEASSLKTMDLPEINEIAQQEWEQHLSNLAFENISTQFSGHAIEAFKMSMEGLSSEDIAEKLGIKSHSVYRLRSRVKERLIQEVRRLRQELE